MGLNFHIPLPGPFSYSARVTPNIGKTVRQVNRAARTLAQPGESRSCTCSRPAQRPVQRPTPPRVSPRPQDRPPFDIELGGPSGTIALWLLVLATLTMLIVGLAVS